MKIKNLIHSMCSIVLVIAYVLSIGGINVHTCSHTGECYVSLLIEGTSCEDIHPDHHHEACCHHDHHDCDDDGCCTNDSHILQLTGDYDHSVAQKHLSIDAPAILIPFTPAFGFTPSYEGAPGHVFTVPDSGEEILLECCLLRV